MIDWMWVRLLAIVGSGLFIAIAANFQMKIARIEKKLEQITSVCGNIKR